MFIFSGITVRLAQSKTLKDFFENIDLIIHSYFLIHSFFIKFLIIFCAIQFFSIKNFFYPFKGHQYWETLLACLVCWDDFGKRQILSWYVFLTSTVTGKKMEYDKMLSVRVFSVVHFNVQNLNGALCWHWG